MPEKTGLSAPWITLFREYKALFGDDPDIKLSYLAGDGEDPVIEMLVAGQEKADAIERILPESYDFGGVTVSVVIKPANRSESTEDLFRSAFAGNPAFSYAATAKGVFTNPVTYVVFRNKVVQFWNDNIGDINGNESMLYADIAEHLMFDQLGGVCFCTDTPENLGSPVKQ